MFLAIPHDDVGLPARFFCKYLDSSWYDIDWICFHKFCNIDMNMTVLFQRQFGWSHEMTLNYTGQWIGH